MAVEQMKNAIKTTLTAAVDNVTNPVTVSVTDVTQFPSEGNFRIKIDSEILLVTAVAGSNLTATRAQEGTTIASHTNGAEVAHIVTKVGLENYVRKLIGRPELTPPVESGLAWVNQGGASINSDNGFTYLLSPPTNGEDYHIRVKSTPGSTYTLTMAAIFNFSPVGGTNVNNGGLLVRESSTGKFIVFCLNRRTDVATGIQLSIYRFTNPTTYTSQAFAVTTWATFAGQPIWLRIVDDGTNLIFSISNDGFNFVKVYEEARASFLTANQYGYGLNPYSSAGASYEVGMSVLHLTGV